MIVIGEPGSIRSRCRMAKANVRQAMRTARPFKTCTRCGFVWPDREAFLRDRSLTLIGYQVNFEALREGFFLFNHLCGTSLALEAGAFSDLYDGPMFLERKTGGDGCAGHCLHESDLEPCPQQCECAYVREVIRIIRGHRKT